MKRFLVEVDDQYSNELLEAIRKISQDHLSAKELTMSEQGLQELEETIAYLEGLRDLKNGSAVTLESYLDKRGLS